MAEEPRKDHPEDIKSILSDLDAILTDAGGARAAPEPVEPPKAPSKVSAPPEKPVAPIALSAAPPPAPEPPKAVPAPEPPKVAPAPEAPKAAPTPEPPKVAAVSEPPAPVAESVAPGELPADTPKEQIRRVAYIYTSSCSEAKTAFASFLGQAARTISKKPLFLREVLSHEVSATSDSNAALQKSLQVKAAAILAVVEGWPPAKVDELSEACSRANVLFRAVAPGDAQKKSTAVDIIVDMMLLPGES